MKEAITKIVAYTIATLIALAFILGILASIKTFSKIVFGSERFETEDYVVSANQTLWNIAEEKKKPGTDTREYVYELRKLNGIDDCIIYPGQVIKIIK